MRLKQTVLTLHKQLEVIENTRNMKDIDSLEFDGKCLVLLCTNQ